MKCMNSLDRPLRSCRRVTVTEVIAVIGQGTEASPRREATYYYDDDGRLLASQDVGADVVFVGLDVEEAESSTVSPDSPFGI